MKFLFFVLDSASGGTGRTLAQRLVSRGHDCRAYVYNRDGVLRARLTEALERAGVPVASTRAMAAMPLRRFFKDRRLHRHAPFRDLAIAWAAAALLRGASFTRLNRLPVLDRLFGRGPSTVLRTWVSLVADIAEADRMLDSYRPDAVILTHDYAGHFSTTLAIVAQRKGIAVIIAPALFPEPAMLVQALQARRQNLILSYRERRVACAYPGWVAERDGVALLRYEWWRIILFERLGLVPDHPFIHQSCPSNAILLPDREIAKRYEALGFPPERLKITGAVVQDDLAEAKRRRKRRKSGRPRIIVAVPPDQFATSQAAGDYLDYHAVISALLDILQAVPSTMDVVLSVHPKQARSSLQPLQDAGYELATAPLSDLLAGADAFLGYTGSSTLRWGAWVGCPTVVWNVYGYRAEADQCDLDALTTERPWLQFADHRRLGSALVDSITEPGASAWRKKCAGFQSARLDGRAIERIEAEILSSIDQQKRTGHVTGQGVSSEPSPKKTRL